jgi:hypothetical protein
VAHAGRDAGGPFREFGRLKLTTRTADSDELRERRQYRKREGLPGPRVF